MFLLFCLLIEKYPLDADGSVDVVNAGTVELKLDSPLELFVKTNSHVEEEEDTDEELYEENDE